MTTNKMKAQVAFDAVMQATTPEVQQEGIEQALEAIRQPAVYRRLFLTAKNNIGNDSEGLAYQVCGVTLDNGISTSRVEWETEPVTITADEAMRAPVSDEEGECLADAKTFLCGLLADGALPSKQVKADADGAGHSWRTIQRAQKTLGIEAVKEGMQGGWVWKLPPQGCEERHENTKNATQNNVAAFSNLGALQGNAPAENDEIEAVL